MKFLFQNLYLKLDNVDKELFFFDMDAISWEDVSKKQIRGLRTYLLKDSPDTIPYARKRGRVLKAVHYIVVYSIYAILLWILYSIFSLILGF